MKIRSLVGFYDLLYYPSLHASSLHANMYEIGKVNTVLHWMPAGEIVPVSSRIGCQRVRAA